VKEFLLVIIAKVREANHFYSNSYKNLLNESELHV